MKPWEMILAHRYVEAAVAYETQLKLNPDDPDLISAHATALLCLGRFEESLKEIRRANELANARLKSETQPYLETIGTIFWLLGERNKAISVFKSAVDGILDGAIKFADNAGGVSQGMLLWYAGITVANCEVKEHAETYLRRLSKKARIKQWPGALALFSLGQISQDDVLLELCGTRDLNESIHQAKMDLLKRRRLVKSLFYFGARKRCEGDDKGCNAAMIECAFLDNPVLEVEWYLARAETSKMTDGM